MPLEKHSKVRGELTALEHVVGGQTDTIMKLIFVGILCRLHIRLEMITSIKKVMALKDGTSAPTTCCRVGGLHAVGF